MRVPKDLAEKARDSLRVDAAFSTAHPASLMHAVAVAVRFVNGFSPDIPRARWARPSPRPPHPVPAAPVVGSVRPHKARARHYADRAKRRWWRREAHALIERNVIAG